MASSLPPPPYGAPLINDFGLLNPIWIGWVRDLFQRVGGNIADTNDELFTVTSDRIATGAVTSPAIAANAVTAAAIAASIAGAGLSGGGGSSLSVNVDGSTIECPVDTLQVKDGGLAFAKFLATDWTKSLAASGYQKFPSGLYLQWGVTSSLSSATTTTISFPTTFPTACRQVVVGVQGNSAGVTTNTGHYGTGNYTTTGFDLYNRTSVAYTFNYFAVGN